MAQILPQSRYETYLTSSITAAASTIPVATCPATGVTSGYVRIGEEIIKFEGNSNPGLAGNLTSCTRGLALSGNVETTAGLGATHAAGTAVSMTNVHYYLNHTSNERITKIVVTTTDDATAVINVDTTDVYQLSAVANATEFTLTGTPTDGQTLMIRLKDAGVANGLTWDAAFVAIGVTLPTTTVVSKWHYIGCQYNSAAAKWHVLAVSVEA